MNKQPTPATRTTSTAWHPTLRLPVQIAEPLKLTTITYDAAGRVLTRTVQATTDANGSQGFAATPTGSPRTWSNSYDSLGNLIRAQSPDGTATTYTYYPANAACAGCRGQMQSLTDSQGLTTTFDSYDPLGRLLQSTDPYGVVTTQSYDWRGRLLTRTVHAAAPLVTHYTYDTSGDLVETTQPDGAKLYYDYDTAGRLIRLRDTEGNRIDYHLDAMSHKTGETIKDALNKSPRRVHLRNRVVCCVANPRHSSGYGCGLRLASHPDPQPVGWDELANPNITARHRRQPYRLPS